MLERPIYIYLPLTFQMGSEIMNAMTGMYELLFHTKKTTINVLRVSSLGENFSRYRNEKIG